MKKQLGKKAILNKLQKHLDKMYTKEEQDDLGFDIDTEGTDSYTWSFSHQGRKMKLVCCKKTGIITYCGYVDKGDVI